MAEDNEFHQIVTCRIGLFDYHVPKTVIEDGEEVTRYSVRFAREGEEISLYLENDYERGMRNNAFVTEVEEEEEETVEEFDLREVTDEEIVEWMLEDKPSVQDLVDEVDGDVELAERVMAAETKAGESDDYTMRKGLFEQLAKVIESASDTETEGNTADGEDD